MSLNKHQAIAFRRPCYRAEETSRPEYGWLMEYEGRRVSVVLTANIGEE